MTIYAIAIASNLHPLQHTQFALSALRAIGKLQLSELYEIPCRDGIGADYWNCACLLSSDCALDSLLIQLKALENQTGRKRPSHKISLDVDLIAWGEDLEHMQFNPKKLPLAEDVIIPLAQIWQSAQLPTIQHDFRVIETSMLMQQRSS